jgi:hypothetical protein
MCESQIKKKKRISFKKNKRKANLQMLLHPLRAFFCKWVKKKKREKSTKIGTREEGITQIQHARGRV